jgi:hypothetical protein
VASVASSSGQGGQPEGGGPPGVGSGGPGNPGNPSNPGNPGNPGGALVDLAGAPERNWVSLNTNQITPGRGIFEEFAASPNGGGNVFWLPAGFPNQERDTLIQAELGAVGPQKSVKIGAGFIQGAQAGGSTFPDMIFPEAKIKDDPTFTVTPFHEPTQIELRVSNDAVPSDLLTKNEFRLAFANTDNPNNPPPTDPFVDLTAKVVHIGVQFTVSSLILNTGFSPGDTATIDNFPPLQHNPVGMKIEVPQQGLKYTWNGLFDQTPTTPTTSKDDLTAKAGQLLGLQENTLLGSVFVRVTPNGDGVKVGNRTGVHRRISCLTRCHYGRCASIPKHRCRARTLQRAGSASGQSCSDSSTSQDSV